MSVQVFDGDGVERKPVGPWRFTWDGSYTKDNFVEARFLNVICGDIDVCSTDFETPWMVDTAMLSGAETVLESIEKQVTDLVITKGQHRLLEQWPGFGMALRTFLAQSLRKMVPGFG